MNKQEAHDVRERLKPLGRMLEDFDKAIEYVQTAESQRASVNNDKMRFEKERDRLVLEVATLHEQYRTEKDRYQADRDRWKNETAKRKSEMTARLAEINRAIDESEKSHKERMSNMEAEYSSRLTALNAETSAAEKRLNTLQEHFDRLKKRVSAI